MDKRKILLLFLVLILFIAMGCRKGETPKDEMGQSGVTKEEVTEKEEVDFVLEKVNEMTIDEKIGQLLIVGIDGYNIDEKTIKMIQKYHIGGFILFNRNIQDANQTISLINSLKETNESNDISLFISLDEEGGRVTRLPHEFIKTPSSKKIGKKDDEIFTYEIGKTIGRNVKSLGFNLDFAPVLDIFSNPNNTVIGDRAFGTNPKIVWKHGIQLMNGIKSENIIPVIKHFPGHGDTTVDSHEDLPFIDKNLGQIENFELIPFKKAIEKGAEVIMVSHIMLPNIDEANPATLSEKIINNILREELGFDGVIITDDMTMGAIVKNYDIGDASVKSLKAGSDIILVCHDYENYIKVINAIKDAVDNGEISLDCINQKVYRILKLKEKYNIEDRRIDSIDVEELNKETRSVLDE
mgnify:FL=1